MTAPYTLLGRYEVESPDWYAARKHRLGGSEIAAVLGISPYESRFSLWHRKKGLVGPQQMNPEMDWGRRLEPAVFEKYAETRRSPLVEYVPAPGTYVSNSRPYQVANPDAVCLTWTPDQTSYSTRVVEVKTSPFGEGWGKGPEDIPVYYKAQVQWYLDTFESDSADLCVLISGYDYREYTIRYDAAEAGIMRTAAEEFMDSLDANDRPDIDGHDQTYSVIKELHPEITGGAIDVDIDTAANFVQTKRDLSAAEIAHTQARSVLADVMGDAHTAWCNRYKIADRRAKTMGGIPYVQAVSAKQLPTLDQLRTPR